MADQAYTPADQPNAYGPGGGWAPEGGAGLTFLRNPQAAAAAAQRAQSDAAAEVAAAEKARMLFGSTRLLGRSTEDMAAAGQALGNANAEVNRVADFQRRKRGN